jgi:hypothetical protein
MGKAGILCQLRFSVGAPPGNRVRVTEVAVAAAAAGAHLRRLSDGLLHHGDSFGHVAFVE